MSLQLGSMNTSLDRLLVLPQYILIVFIYLDLQRLVLAFIVIMSSQFSGTSWSPFNMGVLNTTTIVHYVLCRVLPGRYAKIPLTRTKFRLFNNEDILSTKHSYGKLFGKSLLE